MPVSQVLECFNCHAPMTAGIEKSDDVVICPVCRSPNGPGASNNFFEPFYVSEQNNRIQSTLAFYKFTVGRDASKIKACGTEFLDTLRLILQKPISSESFREIIEIGIQIGKLAGSIDETIRSGGFHAITEKEMSDVDKENTKQRESERPEEQ
jgi:hypothetical protein